MMHCMHFTAISNGERALTRTVDVAREIHGSCSKCRSWRICDCAFLEIVQAACTDCDQTRANSVSHQFVRLRSASTARSVKHCAHCVGSLSVNERAIVSNHRMKRVLFTGFCRCGLGRGVMVVSWDHGMKLTLVTDTEQPCVEGISLLKYLGGHI